jgi:L-threonylcarbamoyladenylate synthase
MHMQVDLTQAIILLKRGEVVAIPTETVYGLAANASSEEALRQIYAIKQRPSDNPLILHIADASQALDFAAEFPPLAKKLASAFWPGPLTLVLPAKESVSTIVRGNQPTVALRVPSHPITLQLLKQSGLALAAPSANKFTQLSPTTAAHVTAGLGESVPVLDGGACAIGIESTIVSVENDDWRLLRLGMIAETAIEEVAGKPSLQHTINLPKVPGQHLQHYSPKTEAMLFQVRADLINFAQSQKSCAALLFGDGALPNCQYFILPDYPKEAAERLYDTLHHMDALKVKTLLIEKPPNQQDWLAITDRLTRAVQ